jgi:hypothetical protein
MFPPFVSGRSVRKAAFGATLASLALLAVGWALSSAPRRGAPPARPVTAVVPARTVPLPQAPLSEPEKLRTYFSPAYGFSITVPAAFSSVREGEGTVSFDTGNPDDFWGAQVLIGPTPFKTAQEWVKGQPRGGQAGIPYRIAAALTNGAYLVLRSETVDMDGSRPIYGNVVEGLLVKYGRAFVVRYRNQSAAGVPPTLDPAMTAVVASLTVQEPRDPFEKERAAAEEALILFLNALHEKRYEDAAALYGGDYGMMKAWNDDADRLTNAELWQRACEGNGLNCLPVRNIRPVGELGPGAFTFDVWFSAPDNSTFTRGACCGAPQVGPPQEAFPFTVAVGPDGAWRALIGPPYTP